MCVEVVGKNALVELVKHRHRVKLSAGKIIVAALASNLLIVPVCKLGGFLIELVQVSVRGKERGKKIKLGTGSYGDSEIAWNQEAPPKPMVM
jgi:hypothetical protein